MSIQVKKHLVKNKLNGKERTGYYLKVVKRGTVSLDTVAMRSARRRMISSAEMKLAAELIVDGIVEALKDGYFVDLGKLGRLSPALESPMWDTPKDVSLRTPKSHIKINYRPSEEMMELLRTTKLEYVEEDKPKRKPRKKK